MNKQFTPSCNRWRCPNTACRRAVTDFEREQFFSKIKTTTAKLVVSIIYWWARQYPVSMASEEAETTNRTAIDIYQWLREICGWRLLTIDDCHLGGPGSIVQIDKSLFKHKPKVNFYS